MSSASWKAALVAAGAGLQAIDELQKEPPLQPLRSTSTRSPRNNIQINGFLFIK